MQEYQNIFHYKSLFHYKCIPLQKFLSPHEIFDYKSLSHYKNIFKYKNLFHYKSFGSHASRWQKVGKVGFAMPTLTKMAGLDVLTTSYFRIGFQYEVSCEISFIHINLRTLKSKLMELRTEKKKMLILGFSSTTNMRATRWSPLQLIYGDSGRNGRVVRSLYP